MSRARATALGRAGGTRRLSVARLIVFACAAQGGGGCSTPSPATGEAQTPLMDSFVAELGAAMCGWQFRCCAVPEIETAGTGGYLTESACRPVVTRAISERLTEARIGLETNHLSFDAAVAASCIAQFTKGACNRPLDLRPGVLLVIPLLLWDRYALCPSPFIGQLPAGSECFLPSECAPGQSCTTGGDAAWSISASALRAPLALGDIVPGARGHCQPDGQPGTPCSASTDCAPELYCRRGDSVCARPAEEGEVCSTSQDSNMGAIFAIACADSPRDLQCGGGRCHRLPQLGEPCLEESPTGPICDLSLDPTVACVGAGVNGAGVCQAPGQMGAPCVMQGGGLAPCAPALACVSDDPTATAGVGRCGAPPCVGAPCSLDQRCAPPAICYGSASDPGTGIGGIGTGTGPVTGKCVFPGSSRAGSICQSDLECISLHCGMDPGQSSATTCGPSTAEHCAGAEQYVASPTQPAIGATAGTTFGGPVASAPP